MDYTKIESIRNEIKRRRNLLIKYSYDESSQIVPSERERIQSILERWGSPTRPADVITLMKQFCVSSFSYAPLRKYLSSFIDNFPMRDTIPLSLSRAFENDEFLLESNWFPEALDDLALRLQKRYNYDLSRKQFKPRIISVILSGTEVLSKELSKGLDSFYLKISSASTPIAMWGLAMEISESINNVGVALVCDFFKELGFTRYVKVDHHFRREFPELISDLKTCKQSPKKSFILSQEIADSIGITPFHLDSILYLWGRYSKYFDRLDR